LPDGVHYLLAGSVWDLFQAQAEKKNCVGDCMNSAVRYFLPFIEALQQQSHTVEITLDRPNRSQSSGTLDAYATEGSGGVIRGSVGTLWYVGEPKAYVESMTIWLSGDELYIELAPHESPLPIERFPIQNCVPLPFGFSIRGTGFTATLSFSPYRRPDNSYPSVGQAKTFR
jgi:hypothetical protein